MAVNKKGKKKKVGTEKVQKQKGYMYYPMNEFPWKMDDDDDDDDGGCGGNCASEAKEEKTSLERQMQDSFLKNRRIFLWSPIDDKIARDVVSRMLFLDGQGHEDIVLLINSPGGVITSGTAILDAMDAVKSDVVTVVMGQAASMAAVIQAYGAKGKRYAWKRSRIMIHQPLISGQLYGPASDIQIQAEEMLRVRREMNELLAAASGKTVEQIEADTDRDHFLASDEALAYGLIDKVENFQ
jgi:ATP-dependent Clp protease protease subunit